MTAADLVLHGARLLTLAPLREERPRVGPAAGDVGAVMDGFVTAPTSPAEIGRAHV